MQSFIVSLFQSMKAILRFKKKKIQTQEILGLGSHVSTNLPFICLNIRFSFV